MKTKTNFFLLFAAALSSVMLCGCENKNVSGGAVQTQDGTQQAANSEKIVAASSDSGRMIGTPDEEALKIKVSYAGLDNSLIGWGLGRDKDAAGRPLDAVNAQKKYKDYSSLFIDLSESKTLYLTFDEGYENGYTAEILDTLKEKGVKAAFFVTYDYCKSSPELVERMIAEGHAVGNHSYTHPSFPKCSDEQIENEITVLHDYVKDNFGYEMTLFRFPMGEFSERTLRRVSELGYTSVFWSFAYQDWDMDKQPSSAEAFDTVTDSTHDGGVYLLHAVSKANAEALGDIIDYWREQGYTVGDINIAAKCREDL